MNKIIYYIGNFQIRKINAAGNRVINNAKLLELLGYKVIIISCEPDIDKDSEFGKDQLGSIVLYSISYPKSVREWIKYNDAYKQITKIINENSIDNSKIEAIINYGSPRISIFMKKILKYCRKNNITCISDCVDWLHTVNGNFIYKISKGFDTTYQKCFINKKMDALIVISNYLKNYYDKKVKNIIIVPPLSSSLNTDLSDIEKNEDKVNILYAGIPFNPKFIINDPTQMKDRLDLIIKNLATLKDVNFTFHIYGLEKKEVLYSLPFLEADIKELGEKIIFYGLKDNKYILKKIQECDYTILFRDKKRDTMAGFPTKVAESITQGTPVITNDTSDIKKYLSKQNLAFFVSDITNSAIEIRNIIQKNHDNIRDIKLKCLESGVFLPSTYKGEMSEFLKKIL